MNVSYKACFGKVRYDDEKKAQKAANKRMWDEKQDGKELTLRVYACIAGPRPCGGWHLTHYTEPPKDLESRLQAAALR